ncbi:MAG: hypothetical protein ACJAZQ_002177 [Cognaticolwellia sp.]|jgi:hypothetical protein
MGKTVKYFDYYKEKAADSSLTNTEKCGRYLKQSDDELNIFDDICSKLPALTQENTLIIDIGCGCSDPVKKLIKNSQQHNNNLVLVDSEEMLSLLPDLDNVTKINTQFPDKSFVEAYQNKADAIIVYSVFHCVYLESDFIMFADSLVKLLNNGGTLLLADLPNATKKKRFLSSEEGKAFHKDWSGEESIPEVNWNQFEAGSLDDSLVMMLMMRYRQMGYETYLVPQNKQLPFSNTREDILVRKW